MNKQASNWLIIVAVLITAAAVAALARAENSSPQTEAHETTPAYSYISAEGAWIRPTLGANRNTAAYVTLMNTGSTVDRLIGGSLPGADKLEVHNSIMEDGVMRMRRQDGIDIPAAGSVTLMPGGFHIMVFDLEAPLKSGDTVSLTLHFENAGDLTVKAPVTLSAPANQPGHAIPGEPASTDNMTDHTGHH